MNRFSIWDQFPRPLLIAHRTNTGRVPENSLAGVRAALALGVDAIECDVHCSADGVPVLIHDETLERTTNGAGPVSALTYAQLRRLDAGSWYGSAFTGERIPSLRETLDLVSGRCLLIVEIKQPDTARAIVDLLSDAGAIVWTAIWSFDLQIAVSVPRLEPRLPAALLTLPVAGSGRRLLDTARANNLGAVAVRHDGVNAALARAAHRRGLQIYAWTANAPNEQRRLAACGVDGIASDVPALLRQTLTTPS